MIDPKDIDALLIGALYGELTPADEARLAAHLDSHPTDRSALDGLRFTREAVRESRILAVQLDPPQAISALLLQEAHRRAPKAVPIRERANTDEGWFARFVRSFAAHPAMAAAAMLVLVLGIGGIMYKRHGANQFAESAAPSELAPSLAVTPSAGSSFGSSAAAMPGAADPGSTLEASREADRADQIIMAGKGGNRDQREGVAVTLADGNAAPEKLAKQQGIEVRRDPAPEPKDFAFNDKKVAPAPPPKVATATKAPPATGAKTPVATDDFARGGDKTVVGSANGQTNAVSGAGIAVDEQKDEQKEEQKEQKKDKAKEDETWAKDQHTRVASLAKAGNCPDTATIVAAIAARAPEYYSTHVATDRNLKTCLAYINDAREKDAERANKARVQKRLDANEAPSPAPSK